jgi:hypothetical protein
LGLYAIGPGLYNLREIEARVHAGRLNGRKSQKWADAATRHTVADGTVAGKRAGGATGHFGKGGARSPLLDILLPRQSHALFQLLLNHLTILSQLIEPGAALQIAAGAAQLIAPFPGTDPDGAIGRAAAISASGAAGVGGHPVESPVHFGPVYGLPTGYEGRPHGDLAVGYVLASLARAIRHCAAAQGAGGAEDTTRGRNYFRGFRTTMH